MKANTEWKAVGRVAPLLAMTRAEPQRIFMAKEAAQIMNCKPEYVASAIKFAVANKAMFCKSYGRGQPMLIRGEPFPAGFVSPAPKVVRKSSQTWKDGGAQASKPWLTDPDDPRIGKVVPGWKPPVMRHVRGGA